MGIVNRADILVFLDKADSISTHEESLIELLRPQIEQSVRDLLGYTVEQATYTHYLPETDRLTDTDPLLRPLDVQGDNVVMGSLGGQHEYAHLWLPEIPVRSITTVHEDAGAYAGQGDDDFASGTLLTAGTHYWLDLDSSGLCKSGLLRRVGNWPSRARTVKVVYVAGYTQTELATGIAAPIKHAVLLGIQAAFAAGGEAAGIESERLGPWAATYSKDWLENTLPKRALKMLRKYVRFSRFM